MSPLLLPALLLGCVITYGNRSQPSGFEADDTFNTADFAALDARLAMLLQGSAADRERQFRLEAARDLVIEARTWPPDARDDLMAYLFIVLDVEERELADDGVPIATSETRAVEVGVDGELAPIRAERVVEVPLETPQPVATPSIPANTGGPGVPPAPEGTPTPVTAGASTGGGGAAEGGASAPTAPETAAPPVAPPESASPSGSPPAPATVTMTESAAVAEARAALAAGDHPKALRLLRPVAAGSEDSTLSGLWREAVDGWVQSERTRAGKLFLQARAMPPGDERKKLMVESRDILRQLLDTYPESTFTGAISRNLALVEREISKQ